MTEKKQTDQAEWGTFKDSSKTLSDDEVMEVFNKIIKEVEEKTNAKLRS